MITKDTLDRRLPLPVEQLPKVAPPQSGQITKVEQAVIADEAQKLEEVAATSDSLRRELGKDPTQDVNISRRNSMLQEQGQLQQMVHAKRHRHQRITALSPEGVAQFVSVPSETHKGPPDGPPQVTAESLRVGKQPSPTG